MGGENVSITKVSQIQDSVEVLLVLQINWLLHSL